ncbi:unnamed protein product [Symbiodinium necroappetens]|uniref:Uncharacterized protein n=1 Tax=Symbiodinium necroappetens TaxID=1628268 RepID=A0A812S379_9DINO|nr:unnamed protein product [Symbiodinium necroappetens]
MPALPVLCREVIAETLRDSVIPRDAVQADVWTAFRFDGFLTLAAMRALMMLFFLVAVIAMALWRVVDVADPEPEPDESKCQKIESLQQHPPIAIDKLLSTEDRLSAEDCPETSLQGLPTNLPGICPPYMKAAQGARLSVALPITEQSCDVLGLGASLALRGPPTRLLTANLHLEGSTRTLELREQEPGCKGAEGGRILLTITSDLVLWKGRIREGYAAREYLGTLEPAPLGGSESRRRLLLQRKGAKPDLLVATSSGRVELGLLPSGRLVAIAAVGVLTRTIHDLPSFVEVKAGVDAVYALGCLLAVITFVNEQISQKWVNLFNVAEWHRGSENGNPDTPRRPDDGLFPRFRFMSRREDFDSDGPSEADAGRTQPQDTGRAAGTAPNAENLVEELSEHRAQRTSGSFQSGTEGHGKEEAAQNEALSEHEAKRKSSSLQSGTEERGTEEAAAQDEALHPDVDENEQEHQDAGRAAGTAPNAENLVEEVSEQRAQRTSGSLQSGTEGRGKEEAAQNEALSEHEAKRKSSSLQSGTEERGTEEAAAQDEALHPDVDENEQEHQDTGRAAGTAPNAENLVEEVSEQRAQRTLGSFQSGTEGRRMEEAAQHEALSEHAACKSEEHRIKGADRCSSPAFDALAVQAQDVTSEPPATSTGQPKRKPRSHASEKLQKRGNSLEARAAQKQAKREKTAVKPRGSSEPGPPGPGCRWNSSTEVEVKPDEPSMATLARRPDAPDKLETGDPKAKASAPAPPAPWERLYQAKVGVKAVSETAADEEVKTWLPEDQELFYLRNEVFLLRRELACLPSAPPKPSCGDGAFHPPMRFGTQPPRQVVQAARRAEKGAGAVMRTGNDLLSLRAERDRLLAQRSEMLRVASAIATRPKSKSPRTGEKDCESITRIEKADRIDLRQASEESKLKQASNSRSPSPSRSSRGATHPQAREGKQATGALASSTTARSNRSLRIADKQSREKQDSRSHSPSVSLRLVQRPRKEAESQKARSRSASPSTSTSPRRAQSQRSGKAKQAAKHRPAHRSPSPVNAHTPRKEAKKAETPVRSEKKLQRAACSQGATGRSFKSSSATVFDRLHEHHNRRLHDLKERAAAAEEEEQERAQALQSRTVCLRSAAEAQAAGQRLYEQRKGGEGGSGKTEASWLKQESNICRMSPQVPTVEPRWEQLYASAQRQSERLQQRRLLQEMEEERWMKTHSLHKGEDDGTAYDRLYQDAMQRGQRLYAKEQMHLAAEARELSEAFVHGTYSGNLAAEVAAQRSRCLYEDAGQRLERLAAKRELLNPAKPSAQNHVPFDLSQTARVHNSAAAVRQNPATERQVQAGAGDPAAMSQLLLSRTTSWRKSQR